MRAASMSLYGYARNTTPYLERLAESSVVFDSAFSTSPWTLPAHATMFTGRFPAELSADWQVPLDEKYSTIAEVFRDHGYLTAGFVANRHYANSWY
ncbi:MAG: sulfatase-like hydrolase/transferase, partial [Longimicrobiales bacterium]